MKSIRIALIGDYNEAYRAHIAIPRALDLASTEIGGNVQRTWISTDELAGKPELQLESFDAVWCVPGSPYRDMEGALSAIRFARECSRPFLGTCGGFQHALIEYARNVLGLADADHAETNPTAPTQFVVPLSCSLVGTKGSINLKRGSRIERIYGSYRNVEEYYCNFGLNPSYRRLIESNGFEVTGVDDDGEIRLVELTSHPFFVATLFQPELAALTDTMHPLIRAFMAAAEQSKSQRKWMQPRRKRA